MHMHVCDAYTHKQNIYTQQCVFCIYTQTQMLVNAYARVLHTHTKTQTHAQTHRHTHKRALHTHRKTQTPTRILHTHRKIQTQTHMNVHCIYKKKILISICNADAGGIYQTLNPTKTHTNTHRKKWEGKEVVREKKNKKEKYLICLRKTPSRRSPRCPLAVSRGRGGGEG